MVKQSSYIDLRGIGCVTQGDGVRPPREGTGWLDEFEWGVPLTPVDAPRVAL